MPNVNWDAVPDDNTLPGGLYLLEVEELNRTTSKKGNLMYAGVFRVAEGPMKGTPYFEYFNIGMEGDPMADQESTLAQSMGAKALKKVFKASGQPFQADLDEMCRSVVGSRVVAQIDQRVDDGSRDAKYKGTVRNNASRWWKPGEKAVSAEAGGEAPAAPASRVLAAKPMAPCPHCAASVPRAEMQAHVEKAHPEAAE